MNDSKLFQQFQVLLPSTVRHREHTCIRTYQFATVTREATLLCNLGSIGEGAHSLLWFLGYCARLKRRNASPQTGDYMALPGNDQQDLWQVTVGLRLLLDTPFRGLMPHCQRYREPERS